MAASSHRGPSGVRRASFRALGAVLRRPRLRRLQLAWVGSILGGWAYLVALGVYAYEQGGASAVGLVGLIRLLPAAIVSPFTATLVDRFSRVTVMVASDLVRFGLMIAAAPVIAPTGRRRSSTSSSASRRPPAPCSGRRSQLSSPRSSPRPPN